MQKLSFDFWNRWFRRILALLTFAFLLGLGNSALHDIGSGRSRDITNRPTPASLSALQQQHSQLQSLKERKVLEVQKIKTEMQATLARNGLNDQSIHQAVDVAKLENTAAATIAINNLAVSSETKQNLLQQIDAQVAAQTALLQLEHELKALDSQLQQERQTWNLETRKLLEAANLLSFWHRLALILPILFSSLFLFAKKRNSPLAPFIYGYFWFGLYAFFFQLVPYMPSFGGYIRYLVGLAITTVGGIYGMRQLDRYITQRQQKIQEEATAQKNKPTHHSLETAILATKNNQCPSCQQNWELTSGSKTPLFCPVCATQLHTKCSHCGHLNNALFSFCSQCKQPLHTPTQNNT